MDRQKVLQLPTKRFDFVVAERVLRDGNSAPAEVMTGQLDKLMVATPQTSVNIGIVRATTLWPFHTDNGFWLYDADAVIIETLAAELRLTHADEVTVYARVHAALAEAAVYGTAERALLAGAIAGLG
jgi:Domain of unknown function (DUF5753)